MISRSFRIGSLSAAIPPPWWRRHQRRTTQRRQRSRAPGRGRSPDDAFSDRLAPESVIGFDRNQRSAWTGIRDRHGPVHARRYAVLLLRRIAYTLLALFRAVTLRSDDHRAMRWLVLLRWEAMPSSPSRPSTSRTCAHARSPPAHAEIAGLLPAAGATSQGPEASGRRARCRPPRFPLAATSSRPSRPASRAEGLTPGSAWPIMPVRDGGPRACRMTVGCSMTC